MAGSPALSIIVVSYNTRDLTLAAIASVFAHPPAAAWELIVLDNASVDGSAAAIGAAHPHVTVIARDDNLGFAQGNNVAAKTARGRRLLLLNPDTLVLAGSLDALWRFAEREPGRGIWGGRTLFGDMTLNPTSCWSRMTPWSVLCSAAGLTWAFPRSALFNPEAFGGWRRDTEHAVDIVSGCFLMIDRVLWERLGGFDPAFFMYAEEADLCLRARAFGADPAITPEAAIVHYGGASETSPVDKIVKLMRGRVTLMRKHWSRPAAAFGRAAYWGWALTRLIGSRVLSGPRDRPGEARDKWRAVWRRRREWLAGY